MTKKTLDEKTIDQITERLSHFLSDTFVLYVKTLNFHWNMVGPEFYMYHKLLENQYEELAKAIDEVAERIRMLGRRAPGTMQEFLRLAVLKEETHTGISSREMIGELERAHEEMIERCNETIKFTDSALDQGTSDLLIDRLRAHSKEAWMLRSHLEKK